MSDDQSVREIAERIKAHPLASNDEKRLARAYLILLGCVTNQAEVIRSTTARAANAAYEAASKAEGTKP